MRQLRLISACAALVAPLAFAACSSKTGGGASVDAAPADAAQDLPTPAIGFQIRSPDITIPAGAEITYCWYFHTPNTTELAIKSWQSHMTAGSHHMILYFTGTATQPDGTLDPTGNCGAAATSASNIPTWTYSAQSPDAEADMPADDGNGQPVGMTIPANQPAYFQLHYLNATDSPLVVHATLNANGYDSTVTYTKAAAYVTYDYTISIPAAANGVDGKLTTGGSCDVATTAKFFTMSTHSHKQSIETQVMDGSSMVLMSTDWQHPTIKTWDPSPFFSFASGQLTYSCSYDNPTANVIVQGQSAQTNEMCMAVGYYFPATGPQLCVTYNGTSTVINQ